MKTLLSLLLATVGISAYADGFGTSASGQPSSLPSILMLVVFVVIFYFLLIRPQMKRNKEQRQLLSSIEKGDEVVTAAGLYGKIINVDETSVELEIAKGVVVKLQKQAVSGLLPKGSVAESKAVAEVAAAPAKAKTKAVAKTTAKTKAKTKAAK